MGFFMIEESIKKFVTDYIDSFTSWDVLVFFNNNPQLRMDVNELAANIGRSTEDVQKSVEILSKKNILFKNEVPDNEYFYQPQNALREKIDQFIDALSHREKRMAILSIILEKGAH